MQAHQGELLRKEWESKGNPHCLHPVLDKEYMRSVDTGDHICTTCGRSFAPSELAYDAESHQVRPR